ncbi:MAG: WD40/YVTN/BNR-like repeat-containing protein [Dongiaceae bacterium]
MRDTIPRLRAAAAALALLLAPAVAAGEGVPFSTLRQQTHFHGLAVDPTDRTRLYLATHHGFFVLGADGVATRVSAVQDFMGFTPHPSDSKMLYASGHPAGGGNLGFIASTDGGATWTQLSPGINGPVDFHQMDVSPADPKVIYGAYGSIQVSRDGGKSWTETGPAPEGMIQLAASSMAADRLYAATRVGLLVSDNAGATWRTDGFDTEIVSMVRSAPDGRLLAFVVGRGLLSAAENDVADWTPLGSDRILLHLAIDPMDADRLYAITQDGDVIASVDGGASWRRFGAP